MKKGLILTTSLAVFTVLLLLGIRWLERDNRLNLTRVRIDNSSLVDSVKIAEVLRPCFGVSLLKLDTDSLQHSLLAVEGVDSVEIKIQYPESLIITFSTREPAVILEYLNRSIPVTLSGDPLPVEWGNDNLPVIEIIGEPERKVINAALDLFIKRELNGSAAIQVSNREIVLTEDGKRIILDPERADENWVMWQSISSVVTEHTDVIDLRYRNQAVLRSTEET
jgi:cell division septal protein FtsQ